MMAQIIKAVWKLYMQSWVKDASKEHYTRLRQRGQVFIMSQFMRDRVTGYEK